MNDTTALVESPSTSLAIKASESVAAATEAIRYEVRTLVINGPDIQALLNAVSADLEIAPTMEIDSDDMALDLIECLGRLSTVVSAIEAERLERGRPLREALDWLMDGYRPAKQRICSVIDGCKPKLLEWNDKKAAQARKEAAEAAEKRRQEAAVAAQAEADALAAANKAAADAAALRAAGSEQVADAMEQQAMALVDTARQTAAVAAHSVHTAPVRAFVAPTKGASTSKRWKAECTDKAALLSHIGQRIAEGDKSLIDLVVIDPRAINALGALQKENLNVPGLRSYPDQNVTIRKREVAAATTN